MKESSENLLLTIAYITKDINYCSCGEKLERVIRSATGYFNNGHFGVFDLSVLYCSKCSKHYLSQKKLKEIKSQCAPNIEIIEYEENFISAHMYELDESFLHKMGYNVSDSNISNDERFRRLCTAVEKFSYDYVKGHLEYLIHSRGNQIRSGESGWNYFSKAIALWTNDLKRLRDIYEP